MTIEQCELILIGVRIRIGVVGQPNILVLLGTTMQSYCSEHCVT